MTLTTNVSRFSAEDSLQSISFAFDGPTQTSLVLSPGPNYKLINWTLTDTLPKSGIPWKGRDTYFIYFSRGMDLKEIRFSCTFELVSGSEAKNDTIVTVLHSAFYLYGDDLMTKDFQDLVDRLPQWTYTMPWTAVLKIYDINV